jgi:putative DNA primase/helicase
MGKSTTAEPIAEVLGVTLVSRLTMSQLCDPKSYHVPKLRFAAVNLGTELDAVELGDSATFKAIVSGESIEARPIYGAPFTMATACKLWFLANALPRFRHGSEAELRRTRFLRFDHKPTQKDTTLRARLATEKDGVFRWMVDGLRELLTMPAIPQGGRESRTVHARFKISNDPIGTFVSTRCILEPSAMISKDSLNEAFKDFCEQHEIAPSVKDWFFRSLYERWPNLREVRKSENYSRRRCVAGIQLRAS